VLDGASAFRTLWSVILPTAVPSLLVVGVWQFLYSWNEFFLSLVVMTNQSMKTVPLLPLVFQGPYMTDPGALFAILTVVSVVPMVVYACVQKWFVRGLMEGGVKE
jgi:raffinose/stachyose/melibiose transport system permease protein